MKITWNGLSCFTIESQDGTLVFDPYQDGAVRGLGHLSLTADKVLCSHEHSDHNGRENVSLTGVKDSFQVSFIDSWHDDAKGSKRGPNRIYIIRTEGMTVVHMGDIGCSLTGEQYSRLKGCDVLMIPVGGYFTIDGKQAADFVKKISPRIAIPMHYRTAKHGHAVISTVEPFEKLSENVVYLSGNILEVVKSTPAQTAIFTLD